MAMHLLEAHELLCTLHGLPKRVRPKMRADVDAAHEKEPFRNFVAENTPRTHVGRVLHVPFESVSTVEKLINMGVAMTEAIVPNALLRPTETERRAEIERRAGAVLGRVAMLCADGNSLSDRRAEALRKLLADGVHKVDADTIALIYAAASAIHREKATAAAPVNPVVDPLEDGLASSGEED